MSMSPRLLRPRQTLHPEAAAWKTAVVANGGSVSGTTLSAVDKFCKAIASAGIRDRFYRLNLFCGTGLNACLVPLYRGPSLGGTQYGNTTDTNVGPFVSGDYVETGASGGLLGNGTSKYLNTGFNVSELPGAANCHLASYITGTQDIQAARALVGVLFNVVTDRYRIYLNSSTAGTYNVMTELGKANNVTANRANSNGGLMLSSRTSTTLVTLYDDAVEIGTNTTLTAETTGAFPFFVFARGQAGTPSEYYNGRMAAYSIGAGMSGQQAASYYTAMQAFQTALGRNV